MWLIAMTNLDDYSNANAKTQLLTLEEAEAQDRTYWHDEMPLERLAALKFMCQLMYGYDPHSPRVSTTTQIIQPDWCK